MADFEDDLYEMSDEELEAAFKEAKANVDDEIDESEVEDSVDESVDEVEETDVDTDDEVEDLDEDLESDEDVDTDEDSDEEDTDEDDSEQPEGDSDHDTSDEDEVEEDSEEETEETDEDDPDGDTEEDDADTTEEETKTEAETQKAQKLTFKANGQEYNFTEQEIKEQFPRIFGQAMDYTKKMQAIKPYRKTIDAIEQANLKHEDINLMIDVLKGDKDAVAEVLKRTGVDALELDTDESKYVAKDYGRDETALELDDVINDINKDAEYAVTSNILGKQWDDASWKEMSSNPRMIKQLHMDVQSGMYDKVAPIMNKMKVFEGGTRTDLEYYKEAAKVYFSELQAEEQAQAQEAETNRLAKLEADKAEKAAKEAARLEEVRKQEAKRKATKKASSKRKAAAPTTTKSATKKVIDYLDDDDEAYDEWYRNLQADL